MTQHAPTHSLARFYTSDNWIAFWFIALVVNTVNAIATPHGYTRVLVLLGVCVTGWMFIKGFLAAMRRSKQPATPTPQEQPE